MDIEKAFNSFYHIFAICVLKKFAFSSGNFWQTWRTFQTQTKNIKKNYTQTMTATGFEPTTT